MAVSDAPEGRAERDYRLCSLWSGSHGHDHSAGLRGDPWHRTHCPLLALLGPRQISDLSPQVGPKRTLLKSRSSIVIL